MKKSLIFSGLIALFVSFSSMGVFYGIIKDKRTVKIEHLSTPLGTPAVYTIDAAGNTMSLDFNETAEKVLEGVVHIKSTRMLSNNRQSLNYKNVPDPFRDFFGNEFDHFFGPHFRFESPVPHSNKGIPPAQVGTGSGVIISEDGYIVTNNHVIDQADDIEVTLNDNRSFRAKLIGSDPSTDLALIQIKASDLPIVPFVDSDKVHVGQWVLAVGNPLGLNSTVTAGIVSAKGRNINILKDKYAVENFIQTDAAINPGNSGGALVNLEGGLIGINTAIASPTGTFAGYGFAIPANIVNKVIEDLIEYGFSQRGVLGIMIRTVDGNLARAEKLSQTQGVYVDSLLENSAAGEAGIITGDVITQVNGTEIRSSAELQGLIARYRPGEVVRLSIDRDGKEIELNVTLNNREGLPKLARKEDKKILKLLGIETSTVDEDLASELGISGGVKVEKIYHGKISKYTQMREGFIITKVDGKKLEKSEDLLMYLEGKSGGVMLEGIYEDIPGEYYYAFGL